VAGGGWRVDNTINFRVLGVAAAPPNFAAQSGK
jgi:hypothetical protein